MYVAVVGAQVEIVCILSYTAFFVGTSRLQSQPTQYTSSGTEISHVNVCHEISAFQLFNAVKLLFIVTLSLLGNQEPRSVVIVLIIRFYSFKRICKYYGIFLQVHVLQLLHQVSQVNSIESHVNVDSSQVYGVYGIVLQVHTG